MFDEMFHLMHVQQRMVVVLQYSSQIQSEKRWEPYVLKAL